MYNSKPKGAGHWLPVILACVHALVGISLLIGGVELVRFGGSWYYLIAGLTLLISAFFLFKRRFAGIGIFAILFLGTVAWSAYEAGLDYWQWVPRLGVFLVLAILNALITPTLVNRTRTRVPFAIASVLGLVFVGGFALAFVPHGMIEGKAPAVARDTSSAASEGNWTHYGKSAEGTRYAPYGQITKENVDKLEVAWTFHTGEVATAGLEDQNTPLQIGDTVYVCTPKSQVIAVDADTGAERWRFNPKSDTGVWQRCRGVGYFDEAIGEKYHSAAAAEASHLPAAACRQRIIVASNDARLHAVDAHTGELCESFGQHGSIQLREGMGPYSPGIYSQTSAPLVARDLIIVGGRVYDNVSVGEPSV